MQIADRAKSAPEGIFLRRRRLRAIGGHFSDLAVAEIERTLIVDFLLCHRHTYTKYFQRQPAEAANVNVLLAEEYIEANWDSPLDVERLAKMANISARSLFRQFKKSRGYSPLTFIKKLRLQKARDLLLSAGEQMTVTSVALRCGFQNVGHFANDYRLEFRELPSETLARGRQP